MSTFSGFLDEIKDISIDRFDGNNLQSKVFFLSHCHTDHMVGLKVLDNGLPGPLYLSKLSSVIIRRQFPKIVNIKCLDIGAHTIISIPQADEKDFNTSINVVVTAIPAGHCPGSVMFLFEQGDKKILYTGDFRLQLKTLQSMNAFKSLSSPNQLITLDSAYIDSTFLSPKYPMFPKQQQSIDQICEIIDVWLKKCDQNNIVIRPPAMYGYEYLFTQIAKKFKQKIHMSQQTYDDYKYVPEFDGSFDRDSLGQYRIHLCNSTECTADRYRWDSKSLVCMPNLDAKYICIIRPTAMKWNNLQTSDKISSLHEADPNVQFVCYSNHSSYGEISDFLKYLKPKKVKLNVVPNGTKIELEECVRNILDRYQEKMEANKPNDNAGTSITFKNIPIKSSETNTGTIAQRRKRMENIDFQINHPVLKKRKRC